MAMAMAMNAASGQRGCDSSFVRSLRVQTDSVRGALGATTIGIRAVGRIDALAQGQCWFPTLAAWTLPPLTDPTIELPRDTLGEPVPPATGHTYLVGTGGNLQAVLDSAKRGDVVLLMARARWRGTFVLRKKAGTVADGWVRVHSTGQLPLDGVRVMPGRDSSEMATLVAPSTAAALITAPGASGWDLDGLRVESDSALAYVNYGLVLIGDGSQAQNTLASVPSDIRLRHMLIGTVNTVQTKRCIALNAARTSITDSWLVDCNAKGADSQAIGGWNGPGPYVIRNNQLGGAGENIMFGGADPAIPGLIPADISVIGNYIAKDSSWRGRFTVKNLLEVKNVERLEVRGNVLDGSWVDGQVGFGMLIKATNQSNHCPWCTSRDIVIRFNLIRNVINGISIAAHPEKWPVVPVRRVLVEHNVWLVGYAAGTTAARSIVFSPSGELRQVSYVRNTSIHAMRGGTAVVVLGDAMPLTADSNRVSGNLSTWGVQYGGVRTGGMGGSVADGLPAVQRLGLTTFFDNVFLDVATFYIPRYQMPGLPGSSIGTMVKAGFTDAVLRDYRLLDTSPYYRKGIGADVDLLRTVIDGVVRP